MKRIISLALLLACVLSLSFTLTACNGGDETAGKYGVTEADGKTYFVADGAAIVIENGNATACDASAVTGELASKVFNAPDSTGAYFVYTEIQDKINITGLTDEGKAQKVIIIPNKIDGKTVALISAGAFDGIDNLVIAKLSASVSVSDDAFRGVKNVFLATSPDLLEVTDTNLLKGSASVKLYVSSDMLDTFTSHYRWKNYKSSVSAF